MYRMAMMAALLTAVLQAQSWRVWERTAPRPRTRLEWLAVGQIGQGTGAMSMSGWSPIAPMWPLQDQTGATLQYEATLLNTIAFHNVCYANYYLWIDAARTRYLITDGPGGAWGYFLVKGATCWEVAADEAWPGTFWNPDPRVVTIQGARVAYTRNGMRSLAGAPVTIPTSPPIVVPSLGAGTAMPDLTGAWNGPDGAVMKLKHDRPETRESAAARVSGSWGGGAARPGVTAWLNGVFDGQTLQASYEQRDGGQVAAGTLRLALSSDGKRLEGSWYQYGQSGRMVWTRAIASTQTVGECAACAEKNCRVCDRVPLLLCTVQDGTPESRACEECLKRSGCK